MTTIYNTVEGTNMSATTYTTLSTGGFIGDGTKITLNNPTYVVITNSSNQLTTSQYLPTSMGGFGLNPTSSTGVLASNGTSLIYVPYSNSTTGNTLVLRDNSGNITASLVTATSALNTPNITFPIGSLSNIYIGGNYVQTTNATSTTLSTINTSSTGTTGQKATAYLISCEISLGDATAEVNTGSYMFSFKAKNISGTTTVSSPLTTGSMLDGALSGTSYALSTSGTNILIAVTGLASVTINWSICYRIVATIF